MRPATAGTDRDADPDTRPPSQVFPLAYVESLADTGSIQPFLIQSCSSTVTGSPNGMVRTEVPELAQVGTVASNAQSERTSSRVVYLVTSGCEGILSILVATRKTLTDLNWRMPQPHVYPRRDRLRRCWTRSARCGRSQCWRPAPVSRRARLLPVQAGSAGVTARPAA